MSNKKQDTLKKVWCAMNTIQNMVRKAFHDKLLWNELQAKNETTFVFVQNDIRLELHDRSLIIQFFDDESERQFFKIDHAMENETYNVSQEGLTTRKPQ